MTDTLTDNSVEDFKRMHTRNERAANYPVHDMFLDRWSPRSFTEEKIPREVLLTILEAARWAPSAFNSQPWRIVYAFRNEEGWASLLSLLVPFNQVWAKNAAALVLLFSKLSMIGSDGKEETLRSHAFDVGAAWSNLAMQAMQLDWHCHCMLGFDQEGALAALSVPSGFRAEAAIAIGRRGDVSRLDGKLAAREKPSSRLPLSDIAAEGRFPG